MIGSTLTPLLIYRRIWMESYARTKKVRIVFTSTTSIMPWFDTPRLELNLHSEIWNARKAIMSKKIICSRYSLVMLLCYHINGLEWHLLSKWSKGWQLKNTKRVRQLSIYTPDLQQWCQHSGVVLTIWCIKKRRIAPENQARSKTNISFAPCLTIF